MKQLILFAACLVVPSQQQSGDVIWDMEFIKEIGGGTILDCFEDAQDSREGDPDLIDENGKYKGTGELETAVVHSLEIHDGKFCIF